jgi:hypothetical protein
MIKSYGSAARFNVKFGNPHSNFYHKDLKSYGYAATLNHALKYM